MVKKFPWTGEVGDSGSVQAPGESKTPQQSRSTPRVERSSPQAKTTRRASQQTVRVLLGASGRSETTTVLLNIQRATQTDSIRALLESCLLLTS